MRIAYVCRDLADDHVTGHGAEVFAAACAAVAAGHEVYLLSEQPSPTRAALGSALAWRPIAPPRPRHRYLTEGHGYADRVYDALRALHADAPLDVVEFTDAGAEGLTAIRAKRLLGEFGATRLTVTLRPWAAAESRSVAGAPDPLAEATAAFGERYCVAHADEVVAASAAVTRHARAIDRQVRHRPLPPPAAAFLPPAPAAVDPAAARTVWFLGRLGAGAGVETLLRAAAVALERAPWLRLVCADPTSPPARSVSRMPLPPCAAICPSGCATASRSRTSGAPPTLPPRPPQAPSASCPWADTGRRRPRGWSWRSGTW